MKQDRLEQFINNNKAEFDSETPPPMVWMNLEKEMEKQKATQAPVYPIRRPSIMRVMQVAAMFVVIMGVGLLIGLQINKNNLPFDQPHLQEFAEVENYYNNQVQDMWTTVKATGIEDENTIAEDLAALEEVYNELRKELTTGPAGNADAIVNAMIQNHRNKIEILETVLEKYKVNQQINLEDDKVEI